MDTMVGRMMAPPHDVTMEHMNSALRAIPVYEDTIEALRLAHASGAEIAILSDANEHYIDTILEHLGLRELVSAIVTNKSIVCPAAGAPCPACDTPRSVPRLHILPHQPEEEAHGCPLCPQNLCKGSVLERWRAGVESPYTCVVYVGDGGGDYCPSVRLSEGDIVMCRKDWTLHKNIRGQRGGAVVRARVVPWADGAELLAEFRSLFITVPQ